MKYLIVCFLLFSTCSAFAQVGLSYFPWNNKLGVSSNTEKKLWGEVKFEVNTFFGNLNTDLALMYNVKQKEQVNYYVGLGVSTNFIRGAFEEKGLNGYNLYVGSRIKPFTKYPGVQIIAELAPYINSEFSSGLLQANFGVGYQFLRKRKKDK